MYAVKDTPHILIINPALPFFPSLHFSAVSVRSTAALAAAAAAAAYLCRCGSWCWGSTDGRSCRTGTPRTAELWSGHGKTYRPRQCHRSGTGCHRLTSTGRSGRRSEQSHTASGGNYISRQPYWLMWPLQSTLQIYTPLFWFEGEWIGISVSYPDILGGRCRSNQGDIWGHRDLKAKERRWQGRRCRTAVQPHCRCHMRDGTLWSNQNKKQNFNKVTTQTCSRMFADHFGWFCWSFLQSCSEFSEDLTAEGAAESSSSL